MFERYSERVRRVIFMAFWSARKRGASYIEPEDLLHAVIREDNGGFVARTWVTEMEITFDDPGAFKQPWKLRRISSLAG